MLRTGHDCAWEADQDAHSASQLRTPSAGEQNTHQLPDALARELVDSDDANLPGACAGPDGEPGDGAVNRLP